MSLRRASRHVLRLRRSDRPPTIAARPCASGRKRGKFPSAAVGRSAGAWIERPSRRLRTSSSCRAEPAGAKGGRRGSTLRRLRAHRDQVRARYDERRGVTEVLADCGGARPTRPCASAGLFPPALDLRVEPLNPGREGALGLRRFDGMPFGAGGDMLVTDFESGAPYPGAQAFLVRKGPVGAIPTMCRWNAATKEQRQGKLLHRFPGLSEFGDPGCVDETGDRVCGRAVDQKYRIVFAVVVQEIDGQSLDAASDR